MGTARAIATSPLKRIPNFMSSPRREILFSFGTCRLLEVRVIESRGRLAWAPNPPGRAPRNYAGAFLIRQRPPSQIPPPRGRSQVRAARDSHRPSALVLDQR